jgi:UDP-2,4-diacetamido-2,4,6-trideoxy-beta-L-altropyranose hydrolase
MMTAGFKSTEGIWLRRANAADSERLFLWRNHEAIRQHSTNPDLIEWDSHQSWLDGVLNAPDSRILLVASTLFLTEAMLIVDKKPIEEAFGVLRYDLDADRHTAQVSIYLSPARLGQGLGARLLRAGSDWLHHQYPSIRRIRAVIRSENEPSLKVFEKAGYQRRRPGIQHPNLSEFEEYFLLL